MVKVIFSHGFGVKADARGLFTEIAASFPEHDFVMFDYNILHENNEIEVAPLTTQAKKLAHVIGEQQEDGVIIAHSQGCLTAAMTDLNHVTKVILLAPPVKTGMQRVVSKLMKKPNAEINLDGMSKFPRSDGSTTLISKEYLDSIKATDAMALYQNLADSVPTTIVRCLQDEVLGLTDVNTIKHASHSDINTDHNFSGDGRPLLMELLRREITN